VCCPSHAVTERDGKGDREVKSYPINLVRLEERRCVVVGGGDVAHRKVDSLLDADAQQVVVISLRLNDGLAQLQHQGCIQHLSRAYRSGDLKGAYLVVATTDDPAVNRAVWQDAEARGILVNLYVHGQDELGNWVWGGLDSSLHPRQIR
jgi:precorrin-2 dehydrogenase/sirohydrochlorin ferrochelatase